METTPQSSASEITPAKESLMGTRIQFVCRCLDCRRQVEIEVPTDSGVGNVISMLCICGSKMKKVHSEPVFQELSKAEGILRLGDSVLLKTQGKTAG
jgi:hypothetical protein